MHAHGEDYAKGHRKLPGRKAARFMALAAMLLQKAIVGNPHNQITHYEIEKWGNNVLSLVL